MVKELNRGATIRAWDYENDLISDTARLGAVWANMFYATEEIKYKILDKARCEYVIRGNGSVEFHFNDEVVYFTIDKLCLDRSHFLYNNIAYHYSLNGFEALKQKIVNKILEIGE